MYSTQVGMYLHMYNTGTCCFNSVLQSGYVHIQISQNYVATKNYVGASQNASHFREIQCRLLCKKMFVGLVND